MKHLFRLLSLTALVAMLTISCGKENPEEKPEKPIVTADMFSVTANAETGEVVFKFTAEGLSPFWTVTEPSGSKSTFTDREVTKTYKARGEYKGTLIAYGDGGQSDPAEFSFTIGTTDPTLSATENMLVSTVWKLRYYGWYGGEGDEFWDYHEKVPSQAADDRLTFEKGGAFKLNLGDNKSVYNDDEGFQDGITVSGNEKWAYVKEGDAEYIQFSDGGFPGMLGGTAAINGKYLISIVADNSFSLCYKQSEEQWFYVTLVPEEFEEAPEGLVTESAAKEALTGKTFLVSDYGWWGDGWQYFAVADGGEDGDCVPTNVTNDRITFNANGALTLNFGVDDPVEEGGDPVARVYNDGVANGELYTPTGNEKWAVVVDGDVVKVQFTGGGFPLMIAGLGAPGEPNYHFGIDEKWTVTSIEEGTVRLDIYQAFNEQYFTVFLTPAE